MALSPPGASSGQTPHLHHFEPQTSVDVNKLFVRDPFSFLPLPQYILTYSFCRTSFCRLCSCSPLGNLHRAHPSFASLAMAILTFWQKFPSMTPRSPKILLQTYFDHSRTKEGIHRPQWPLTRGRISPRSDGRGYRKFLNLLPVSEQWNWMRERGTSTMRARTMQRFT